MIDQLNELLTFLDKIQGLSGAALVALSCIVVGYGLRFIKAFPNEAIPVVVILWGGLFMSILADPKVATMPFRVWLTRNVLVGLVIGFVAWLFHYVVLSKIECWIGSKFPSDKPPEPKP